MILIILETARYAMSENKTNRHDTRDEELTELAAMSSEDIDTSDIPEVTDWSRAKRAKFYRPGSATNVPQ